MRRAYRSNLRLRSTNRHWEDARRGQKGELGYCVRSSARDNLILTKGIGIEATAIIAREREVDLSDRFSPAFLSRARSYLTVPGISVLKEALIAAGMRGVHAMHDPTEGGVATAIHELAHAAKLGAVLWEQKLLIAEETKQLCEEFHLNPLGVISSGALLIAAAPTKTSEILFALSEKISPVRLLVNYWIRIADSGLSRTDNADRCPFLKLTRLLKFFRFSLVKGYKSSSQRTRS